MYGFIEAVVDSMSWMQHALIWSFLQIVYCEIKWVSSETTVRVPISQLFRLDCCTGMNVCGNITWYHWDVTNGSYDEFPFKWSKYLGLSRPVLYGSELFVPSATFMKVGRYRCHNGDLRRSKNFTVKLCSELKVPAATPPQKFTKGRIGGDVNLQCSFNFACGKGFEPFHVYWQQKIDGVTRNVDENLVLNVQSDDPVLVDKTTYHDIRLNSTLAFKARGADFRSTYICVVNYTGSMSTISKFYTTQLIEEEASDPQYSPVHVEGFYILLSIVPMAAILITFLKRETISSQWKSISPYKYKRGEDMEYDVFLYDECDTQIFRDLFTLLQTRGYDVCSLEDITPGAFTIDTAGTFLKTSQKVIIIYSKYIITKDIENYCNIQKLHNRYFNTIKAVVKEKKNPKDIFLLCETDDNGADKLVEFPDVDIPSYCYHTSHVNINNGEFIESLCKKLPKPTKK